MAHRILILGGTTEARRLAGRLAATHDVTLSLAGRTASPAAQGVPVRVGGFGGADGLARHLVESGVTLVVDATHPFAARISPNAVAAAGRAGVPLVVLRRPPWRPVAGDRWVEADSIGTAVDLLGALPRRVFVALGRQELAPLAAAPHHHYLVRSVDPVEPRLALPNAGYIRARGPFDEDDEAELLSRHSIDAVLAKNSGGEATYAKIAAARRLGIPVHLVRRPPPSAGRAVESVEEALAAIAHLPPPTAERGA